MAFKLLLSGIVTILLVTSGPASAIAADPISMRIEVYGLAGLHVLTLHSRIEQSESRYAITVDYATAGVAGLFVEQATHAQVRGRLVDGLATPEWFRNDTRRNGRDRHSRVDYRPDGAVEGGSTPAPLNPAAPDAVRGTVDNLTAYFRLERQLAQTGSCLLTVPVFDGRFRYDLVFTDAGKEMLSADNSQRWQGSAIACHMMRHYRGLSDPEQKEGAQRGTIWYAPLVPGNIVVPVRMQLETQIGTVDAYLAELRGPGVALNLLE